MLIFSSEVAADFIAWSGDACDGAEGMNLDERTLRQRLRWLRWPPLFRGLSFFSRPRVFVFADDVHFVFNIWLWVVISGSHCVTLFEGEGCTGEAFYYVGEGNLECINVNTGTPIGSFSCSPA
ncbi:hypothetical protein F5878DRAFT_611415 [Lentinula raphanica]|uniref:Uncharacterized protein n=1 Tax=Lentinula raphanica TaxID=153919 RepID=A0AA38UGX6_9AGAR|nr:hypothetical protein F5878DRAFT_611415 [Lentinula raphanica]